MTGLPRYTHSSLGGGWWTVLDRETGREVRDPKAYADSYSESMGSKPEAVALAALLNRSNA